MMGKRRRKKSLPTWRFFSIEAEQLPKFRGEIWESEGGDNLGLVHHFFANLMLIISS
jgi:hypothetical protein